MSRKFRIQEYTYKKRWFGKLKRVTQSKFTVCAPSLEMLGFALRHPLHNVMGHKFVGGRISDEFMKPIVSSVWSMCNHQTIFKFEDDDGYIHELIIECE